MKSLKFVFKYTPKYFGPFALTVVSMILLVGVQLPLQQAVEELSLLVGVQSLHQQAVGVL